MSLNVLDGGAAAFPEPVHVGLPFVEDAMRESFHSLVDEAFDRRYLTNNGPLVRRFEQELADLHKVQCCTTVCNATVAQILLMKAMGLEGEVIIPSFTFIATAHACLWQGLEVVFCDISPDTLMIDPSKVESLITPCTSAVVGVHIFGNMCDADALSRICSRHGLKLIFDAAHAFNCSIGDTPAGSFGDGEFLSFHATKFLGSFEGGAILCNNKELDERIRLLRNFGFHGYDDVTHLGINGKMSEASAAMGLASLPMVESRTERLKRVHHAFRKELSGIPGIRMLPVGKRGASNYHYAVVLVDEDEFGVSRDILNDVLWAENIRSRRYFFPGCHQMEYYRSREKAAVRKPLNVTERVVGQVLCLPTNLGEPERDAARIAETVREAHSKAGELRAWKSRR